MLEQRPRKAPCRQKTLLAALQSGPGRLSLDHTPQILDISFFHRMDFFNCLRNCAKYFWMSCMLRNNGQEILVLEARFWRSQHLADSVPGHPEVLGDAIDCLTLD